MHFSLVSRSLYVQLNWPLLLIYYVIRISRDRFYGSYNSHYRSQVAQDLVHVLITKMPIIVNLKLIFLESISLVFPVKFYLHFLDIKASFSALRVSSCRF